MIILFFLLFHNVEIYLVLHSRGSFSNFPRLKSLLEFLDCYLWIDTTVFVSLPSGKLFEVLFGLITHPPFCHF